MNNNNVLEEFFVWEEKNSTDLNQNLLKNVEQDKCVTTIETKTDSTPNDWRDITNPKLRKKMADKAYREANRDKVLLKKKVYRKNNKDKIKLSDKAYREANRDKVLLKKKAYYESNKDKIKIQKKIYCESNKDKINSYFRNKTKTDIQYKLRKNLRCRLRSAINNNQKVGSAVKDLGCTIDELKPYLESKFQSGMTWDNWTSDGWHIDHIKPLSSFDLTDRHQFLEACHYTNLQPLWAKDNLLKSDTWA
jgi:light-regulated signal transduction histidine kinase (bacteriophytochrome)